MRKDGNIYSTNHYEDRFSHEVHEKYKLIRRIGIGGFSVVWSAINRKTGCKVAIKKIFSAFSEKKRAWLILRELKLLAHFRSHENIITIQDIILPSDVHDFSDVYVVLELMGSDLHRVLMSRNSLNDLHYKTLIYQLLRGLKYIHTAGVIHRDLKPNNVLLNSNCDLKICDFGSSREVALSHSVMELCTTRWYRPPEGLMASTTYSAAVDMWSLGCIFAEMINRKPLFPGRNPQQQLLLITEFCGKPTPEEILNIEVEWYRKLLNSLPKCKKKSLSHVCVGVEPEGIDLLGKMLAFFPKDRITVQEALKHPYLKELADESDEPSASPFKFNLVESDFSIDEIKEMIINEILKYNDDDQTETKNQEKDTINENEKDINIENENKNENENNVDNNESLENNLPSPSLRME